MPGLGGPPSFRSGHSITVVVIVVFVVVSVVLLLFCGARVAVAYFLNRVHMFVLYLSKAEVGIIIDH